MSAPRSASAPPARLLSLVLPLYDEAESIERVAADLIVALEGSGEPFELVFVDNGSRDATRSIVTRLAAGDPRIVPLSLDANRGFGGGVLAGMGVARGDLVGFMGGDGQVTAGDLVAVVRAARESGLDLAKGRRIARHDGWRRRFVSLVYNGLFRLSFPCRVHDVNGSPKVIRRPLLESMRLRSTDWFLDAEIVLKASVLKARIGEVPLTFRRRQGGGSHVRLAALAEFARNMLRYRFTPKSAWFGGAEGGD